MNPFHVTSAIVTFNEYLVGTQIKRLILFATIGRGLWTLAGPVEIVNGVGGLAAQFVLGQFANGSNKANCDISLRVGKRSF